MKRGNNDRAMRLKDIADINARALSEQTRPDYNFTYIDIGSVDSDGNIATGEQINFGEAPSRARRIVTCNDIIVSTVRTYLKAIAFIDDKYSKNTIASTGFAVLTPHKQACPKFIYYAIRNDNVIDEITKRSIGVSYPAISTSELSTIEIDIPSLEVQQRVVSYLDAKTAKIDQAIELLKKKRDAYTRLKSSVINRAVTRGLNPNVKLKDSGVDWIGMIPDGWNWHRLKDLGYMYSGLTGKSGDDFRSDDLSTTKPYIPFTNVLNHIEIDPNQLNHVVMNEGEIQNRVKKGDLIFLMSSEDYESIAKSALISEEIGEVYLNSFCRGYRFTKTEADAKFVNYELNSELYRNAIRYEARGFTRINIKVDRIETMFVILPPLSEQRAIASYLDDRCSRIDKATTIVDKQIDAYTRLKKSLINEVVSGKRRV